MESWRNVWRTGVAPLLSTQSLEALRKALVEDDKRLLQGNTTDPPAVPQLLDWPVQAACVVGYCGWEDLRETANRHHDGVVTVGEVDEYFVRTCFAVDQQMGEPAACRHFLNFVDGTPRPEIRKELLAEVDVALAGREKEPPCPSA